MTIRALLRPWCWIVGHVLSVIVHESEGKTGVWRFGRTDCLRCGKTFTVRTMRTPYFDFGRKP